MDMDTHDNNANEEATTDDWFGARDAATAPDTDVGRSRPGDAAKLRSWRTVAAAGVGVVAIGGAAFLGLHATSASDNNSAAAASATRNGAAGGGWMAGIGGPGGGTISAISGSTLTVKNARGTTSKVLAMSTTKVTRDSAATASSLRVGDHVLATGSGTASKLTATRVVDAGTAAIAAPTNNRPSGAPSGVPSGVPSGMPSGGASGMPSAPPSGSTGGAGPGGAGFGGGTMVAGTITAVDGSTLSVTTSSGAKSTVTLTGSTSATVRRTIAFSALRVGDNVTVESATIPGKSTSAVTATAIRVTPTS